MESAWDSGNPQIKISSSVKGREKLVAGRKEISGEGIDTSVEKFLTFSKFHRGSLLNRQPPESAGWMCGPGLCILTLLQATLIQVASRPPLSDCPKSPGCLLRCATGASPFLSSVNDVSLNLPGRNDSCIKSDLSRSCQQPPPPSLKSLRPKFWPRQ